MKDIIKPELGAPKDIDKQANMKGEEKRHLWTTVV